LGEFRRALWQEARVWNKSGGEGRGRPASPPGSGGKRGGFSSRDLFSMATEERRIGL
jgi:hypothetical protein